MDGVKPGSENLKRRLAAVAAGLAALAPELPDDRRADCEDIASALSRFVVPQLGADSPLVIAVAGGGSTGKSTVFNALAGFVASPISPRSGCTRRVVAAVNPRLARDSAAMDLLFSRIRANVRPRPMTSPDEAEEAGDPIFAESDTVPERLVLVDTPDFDTGDASGFANRPAAAEILSVADVVLCLFTNQTYNNKSSSDFLSSSIGASGTAGAKKVALLYRCSRRYSDETVREHMDVALGHLFGGDSAVGAASCIGIWRIDESDDVAVGASKPEFHPLSGGAPLSERLSSLDPVETRADILRDAVRSCVTRAAKIAAAAASDSLAFAVWRDVMRYRVSLACRDCLGIAPQRDLLALFAEEWNAALPWFVRTHRAAARAAAGAVSSVRRVFAKDSAREPSNEESFAHAFRDCFVEKALALIADARGHSIRIDFPKDGHGLEGIVSEISSLAQIFPDKYEIIDSAPHSPTGLCSALVSRPALTNRGGAEAEPGGALVETLADEAVKAVGSVESARQEVREVVSRIRNAMTPFARLREIAGASVGTAGIVGTVTYVVATGDIFSGGSLLSMFGMNDLVAIPALGAVLTASGSIDKSEIEKRMRALFTAWAGDKVAVLRPILENGAIGGAISECAEKTERIDTVLRRLNDDIAAVSEIADSTFGPVNGDTDKQ